MQDPTQGVGWWICPKAELINTLLTKISFFPGEARRKQIINKTLNDKAFKKNNDTSASFLGFIRKTLPKRINGGHSV